MPRAAPASEARIPRTYASPTDQDQALHQQLEHITGESAEQQRDPARRGDPLGLDHAVAPLGEQPETDVQRAEQAELDHQAGDEERQRVVRTELGGQRLEQRGEQQE